MFDSLKFFKSINCPHYNNNTLTCERPYCQFKHPTVQSVVEVQQPTNVIQQQQPIEIKEPIKTESIKEKDQTAASVAAAAVAKLIELPNALENLSNALQTVQQLFNFTGQNQSISKSITSGTSSTQENAAQIISSTLASQLNNLSSMILSQTTTKASDDDNSTKAKQSTGAETISNKKDSTQQIKRQQSAPLSAAAPEYHPTPITELKKLKQSQSFNSNQALTAQEDSNLKRKRSANNNGTSLPPPPPPPEPIKISNETENTLTKKLKTETSESVKLMSKSASINDLSNSPKNTPPKCDIFSFSKLSLSQQVLKRYEMLNKPAPTAAALNDAKSKKKLTQSPTSSTAAQNEVNKNVPHLIIDPSGSKLPLPMRQRYLKIIYDNGKGLFPTNDKACEKAAEQEKSIYDRSKSKTIYINLAANLIKSLRTQQVTQQQQQSPNKTLNSSTNQQQSVTTGYSHEAILSGPKASRVNYSINRTKQIEYKDLSVTQLYEMFYAYILTDKQLDENSFPKWMSASGKTDMAFIPNFTNTTNNNVNVNNLQQRTNFSDKSNNSYSLTNKPANNSNRESSVSNVNATSNSSSILTKICKRCNKTFEIIAKDMSYSLTNSECVFHWGKLRNIRFNKVSEQKYSCCSGDTNSEGCETGKHVYDGDYDGNGNGNSISGYVETTSKTTSYKTSSNIYALDCEMCYTTKGLELARVSIVDISLKEIYDAIVKPEAEVLDYNTRWSGLTEESLKNCNKKLKHVQGDLLKLFDKDTILIGHSLDSDFKALKLIHKTVIDTSVVFPHKLGPPFKRALKNLMSEHLQKIIQEDADGHDSKEDATACIQLMLWKIDEDLKNKKSASMYTKAIANPINVKPAINDTSFKLNNSITKVKSITSSIPSSTNKIINSNQNPLQNHHHHHNLHHNPHKAPDSSFKLNNTNKTLTNSLINYSSTAQKLNSYSSQK